MNIYPTWRSLFLKHIKFNIHNLDVFEFGVCSGKSIKEILSFMDEECFHKIYGFDSFEGLPEEHEEPLWQKEWVKGNFDSRKETKTSTVRDACAEIEKFINCKKYTPVVGFYSDTLKDSLVSQLNLKPAILIDIDVDIYSSARDVLDFIFRNKLYVPGTLLLYDDWGGSLGFENFASGESRAHKEMTTKYGVIAKEIFSIGEGNPHMQKAFVIENI
jgi:hypothetical protein